MRTPFIDCIVNPCEEDIWSAIKRLPLDPKKPFRLRVEVSIHDNDGVALEDSKFLHVSPPCSMDDAKYWKSFIEDMIWKIQ